MKQHETPKTSRCWRDGNWHADELANLSANLERENAELQETVNTLHNLCVSAEKRALKKQDEEITQLKNELQYLVEVCETNLETKDWPRFKYAKRIAAGSNDGAMPRAVNNPKI